MLSLRANLVCSHVVLFLFFCFLFLFCGRISVETVCLTLSTVCDVTICLSESLCSFLSEVFLPAYLSPCLSVCPSVMFILFFFSSLFLIAHSEYRFPTPSSKLCQNWLHHCRGTFHLRAAVHRRCQRPPKGLSTDKTVEAT